MVFDILRVSITKFTFPSVDFVREKKERSQIDAFMDSKERNLVHIPIEFRNQVQYCCIHLDNLSRDTFLEDGTNSIHIRLFSIAYLIL